MIGWIAANVICPYVGTVGFAVMFHVPRRFYRSCGVISLFGWLTYCAALHWTSVPIASFFGTLVVALIARLLTVPMKCPITMFLIPGLFTLLPGASVYYMAYNLVIGDTKEAGQMGFMALKIAFGIVFGIVSVVSIPREVFDRDRWKITGKRKSPENRNGLRKWKRRQRR